MLVVLPAVVFGGLHFHQLVNDHRLQLAAVPEAARGAAARVQTGMRQKFAALIHAEEARPFFHYQNDFYQDGTTFEVSIVTSPLVVEEPPDGVLGYFAYDMRDSSDAYVHIFLGGDQGTKQWLERHKRLRPAAEHFMATRSRHERENPAPQAAAWGPYEIDSVPLHVTAINRSYHQDTTCLREDLKTLAEGADEGISVEVVKHHFQFRTFYDPHGKLRVVAARVVSIGAMVGGFLPECFTEMETGSLLAQGFFIDPEWLFNTMPRSVARQVLDGSQRFMLSGHNPDAIRETDEVADIDLLQELDFEFERPQDRQRAFMKVAINTSELEARFRSQSWRFLGVAAMMIVSLAIGMGLLVRSVQDSLEQARRTENMVAAVTHELRTPLAAVKMYSEMLKDGWIVDRSKQEEYLDRILRETNRLDSLIDRVLQKRKLGVENAAPEPGDLSAIVEGQIPDLKLTAGTVGEDLDFDLAPNLPKVMVVPEGVHAILVNLVENARKYAPVRGEEKILVSTRQQGGKVLLEVSDRGPGIPESERARVFDAFYRIGDEKRRSSRGTGLGLHIVWLQARAMKARVQALGRDGGGATFRVAFRKA